jgi:hypothetical protein
VSATLLRWLTAPQARLKFGQRSFGAGQQGVHGRADVLGLDLVKQRKRYGGKQWIGHGF